MVHSLLAISQDGLPQIFISFLLFSTFQYILMSMIQEGLLIVICPQHNPPCGTRVRILIYLFLSITTHVPSSFSFHLVTLNICPQEFIPGLYLRPFPCRVASQARLTQSEYGVSLVLFPAPGPQTMVKTGFAPSCLPADS